MFVYKVVIYWGRMEYMYDIIGCYRKQGVLCDIEHVIKQGV